MSHSQKRAAILEAEGVRESQVRRAEGEKDAAILRADGLATARLAMATAEAEAIQKIAGALPEGQAAMYLLGMKYLEALPTLAQGKNTTIFLPAVPKLSGFVPRETCAAPPLPTPKLARSLHRQEIIVMPKTQISPEIGYMAFFIDTEGNKMGLHGQN